jgi:hypothetical protein
MSIHSEKWINKVTVQLISHSGGRIKVVEHEEDETADVCNEAAMFLKLDDKRLGRDLKLYSFMSEVAGEQTMICNFLMEVLMPLKKSGLALAYREASVVFRNWGAELFDEEHEKQWNELF